LTMNVGPGLSADIPVEICYTVPCPGTDFEKWKEEFEDVLSGLKW